MDERVKELVFVKELNFDDKLHYIFLTERGERKIIEAVGYQTFHLRPGTALFARIRMKGCAGEEITELMHPFYVTAKTYPFKIVRTGSFTFNGGPMHFVVVTDNYGDEYKMRVINSLCYRIGDLVNCRLEEQVKGRLKFSIE